MGELVNNNKYKVEIMIYVEKEILAKAFYFRERQMENSIVGPMAGGR